ncbi:hypothetical protein [Sorangium sp. So ce1024]|uniref:hypothetical protein n=1 Tax=Sorangium sp. So ce1024 TaxID=3133327 RepID=UPI003F1254D3
MADEDLDIRMFVDGKGPPDIDPYFTEIEGAEAIAQSVALRCYTPKGYAPGHNIDAPNDGVFLPDFVQSTMTPHSLFTAKTLVHGEARKVDGVDSARVSVTGDQAAQRMTISVEGEGVDGEFEFSLTVDPSGLGVTST